jgi:hypothetical protein
MNIKTIIVFMNIYLRVIEFFLYIYIYIYVWDFYEYLLIVLMFYSKNHAVDNKKRHGFVKKNK